MQRGSGRTILNSSFSCCSQLLTIHWSIKMRIQTCWCPLIPIKAQHICPIIADATKIHLSLWIRGSQTWLVTVLYLDDYRPGKYNKMSGLSSNIFDKIGNEIPIIPNNFCYLLLIHPFLEGDFGQQMQHREVQKSMALKANAWHEKLQVQGINWERNY